MKCIHGTLSGVSYSNYVIISMNVWKIGYSSTSKYGNRGISKRLSIW